MAKFKVGDKVRRTIAYTDNTVIRMEVGYEGKVTSVSHCGDFISVDGLKTHEQNPFFVDRFELIEETQMVTPTLKNMKIRIKDEAHSRLLQEALFEMGYIWAVSRNTRLSEVNRPYLICAEGQIYHCDTDSVYFENLKFEEVELVTTYSFKPVDQEAKRKATEKEALQKNVAEMQKRLDEMTQKLESMT